jgi:hypothetical protein
VAKKKTPPKVKGYFDSQQKPAKIRRYFQQLILGRQKSNYFRWVVPKPPKLLLAVEKRAISIHLCMHVIFLRVSIVLLKTDILTTNNFSLSLVKESSL